MSSAPGIDEDPGPEEPGWAILFTAIAAIVISILGFFGNLLTILALPYTRRLRHAATYLVVNLAVAEGLFCVTILPLSAAHLLTLYSEGRSLFNEAGCRVFVFLRYVNIQAELLSIAAIALNRCVLIAIPKKYPNIFSGYKTGGMIAGIWIFSILVMLIPLFEVYGKFVYNEDTEECDFSDDPDHGGEAPRKVFLVLGFLLPCIIIIISYSYIFYKARQSSAKVRYQQQTSIISNNSNNDTSMSRNMKPADGLRSRDIRIARTIGVIFLVFLLCCTPVTAAHYLHHRVQNQTLLLLLHPVYWLQYCMNIMVYVMMNKQYRDAYINYIARWWPDFREITRQKFNWKEEATSGDSKRHTRAGTPSMGVRFNAKRKMSDRKMSAGSYSSPRKNTPPLLTPGTPKLDDTQL